MKDILKLTLILGIISSIAAITIALTKKQIDPLVLQQNLQLQQEAVEKIFPPGASIERIDSNVLIPVTHWIGRKDNAFIGYAFKDSCRGYCGPIHYIVGCTSEGTIIGLNIISHSETNGIGSRITETVRQPYLWKFLLRNQTPEKPWFCEQFVGLIGTNPIQVKMHGDWFRMDMQNQMSLLSDNAVSAISGATISTKFITHAVSKTIGLSMPLIRASTQKMNAPMQPQQPPVDSQISEHPPADIPPEDYKESSILPNKEQVQVHEPIKEIKQVQKPDSTARPKIGKKIVPAAKSGNQTGSVEPGQSISQPPIGSITPQKDLKQPDTLSIEKMNKKSIDNQTKSSTDTTPQHRTIKISQPKISDSTISKEKAVIDSSSSGPSVNE